jgi:hypothetical protein
MLFRVNANFCSSWIGGNMAWKGGERRENIDWLMSELFCLTRLKKSDKRRNP